MSLAASYRRIAPFYDAIVALPLAGARRASLRHLPAAGRCRVLLSGVGTGLDLAHLPASHQYVGTDLVAAMLERARPRARKLDCALLRADSMRLPFADESFDAVVLHLVVAIVSRPEAVLAEAARVLQPGGRLLVLDKFLPRARRARLRRWLSPVAARIATRLDVVFEDVLQQVPGLEIESDEPALAGGWFRSLVLRKTRVAALSALGLIVAWAALPLAFGHFIVAPL